LYSWLRRAGCDPERAEDLTQEFFLWLIANGHLWRADPARGRLRSFLLACLENYWRNEHRKSRRQKRGGGQPFVSLDREWAERRLADEPAAAADPALLFDWNWARRVFENAVASLRIHYGSRGHARRFDRLRPFLEIDTTEAAYQQAAVDLATTPGAVKGLVHRLREKFREHLRHEVRATLDNPSPQDIDAELAHLVRVLEQCWNPANSDS
jgi:RNA polymerase sigma-70 factor (ECF subfamily)